MNRRSSSLLALLSFFALLASALLPGVANAAPTQGSNELSYYAPGEYFTTQDANGCNADVCISVYSKGGSGPTITRVFGSGKASVNGQCVYMNVLVNGVIVHRTETECGDFGGVFVGNWYPNKTYKNGTQICVTFTGVGSPGIVGKPCQTVKA